jgi:hypothetical protein
MHLHPKYEFVVTSRAKFGTIRTRSGQFFQISEVSETDHGIERQSGQKFAILFRFVISEPNKTVAKSENMGKLSKITFPRFIASSFSK